MSIEMHPDLHTGLEEKLAPVCENFFTEAKVNSMNNIRQTYVSVRAGPPPRRGHQVTVAIARAGATQGSAKK